MDKRFNRILSLLTSQHQSDTNFIDFAFFKSIKLMVAVNVIRYQNNHLINTTIEETPFLNLLFTGLEYLIPSKGTESDHNQPITKEYMYQVYYPYLKRLWLLIPNH